jgi:Phage P22-like portal protein
MVGMITDDDGTPAETDDDVVQEAVERFKACQQWQGEADRRAVEDIKFANGDARNTSQWPTKIYEQRTGTSSGDMPCLTINNTRVHNDLIINQMSRNNFGIKVRPTAGKASYKSAQVMQSIIRHIEDISKFTSVRRKVCEHQVDGGIGYVLIDTAYASYKTRNQNIYLRVPRDPTGVSLDPYILEPDGSDARFGFVFERMPRKEFARRYPKWKNKVGTQPLQSSFAEWISDKEIMLAKYYRKNQKSDTLVWWKDEQGNEEEKLASEIRKESGAEIYKKLREDIDNGEIEGGTRPTEDDQVEWFLIAGDTVIDKGDWAGRYIPICRCVGREVVIDGTLDRKGHTRALIDAQRMLNYNASMAVQMVAWQPLAPWIAPARATEGQEQWKSQNINAFPVLLYNDIDDEAPEPLQQIPPPQRVQMPQPSEAHVQGMQIAERQLMMVSGQFQAQMGENDRQSAASGRGIAERQQQGDVATYHFPEHQGEMLRFIGVQLLDLIPKIYDTERTLHVLDEDGNRTWLKIDPRQEEVVKEMQQEASDREAIRLAFNPTLGEYECVSDDAPDFATQREEAWQFMSMTLQQNVTLAGVVGDLLFRYGDFEGADKIAERLEREIKATKPYLFSDQQDPNMVAAQQQNQKLVALNAELMQKLAEQQLRLRGKEERSDIEAFEADTSRLDVIVKAIKDMMPTPAMRAQFEHELTKGAHQHVYDMISQANQNDLDTQQASTANGSGQ